MNGNTETNGANGATNGSSKLHTSEYVIPTEDFGTPRKLRIIIVGAGASGLNMARHLELHTENTEFVMYEKNPEIGGTWFENRFVILLLSLGYSSHKIRYPGCACDIPSHNYQFTWEPNPNWSTL